MSTPSPCCCSLPPLQVMFGQVEGALRAGLAAHTQAASSVSGEAAAAVGGAAQQVGGAPWGRIGDREGRAAALLRWGWLYWVVVLL